SELGLEDSSAGIMPLPKDAPVGKDFRGYLGLDDHAIELDLTPDRGDCLSVAGVAREVGVINRTPVTIPKMAPVSAMIKDHLDVILEAPEACPRYCCRIIRNIDAAAETPLWMQERLRRSDIRSISPVVDVTNYVLLELGQPMHGFDLHKIEGRIRVRMAETGEKLTLLDGQEIELKENSLIIADEHKPLALAGIMGGADSGVTEETKDLLLESAFFTPTAIIGKARAYGLHTDSSHRFERGVDPDLQLRAMERATELLLGIVGGDAGPVVEVTEHAQLPPRPHIHLRKERVGRILGVEIDEEQIEEILTRLEMLVEENEDGWQVTPPTCRFDIGIEVDLIEEIGRIYGYANIPVSRGHSGSSISTMPETAFDLERAKRLLVDRGYHEVVSYSFISPEMHRRFDPVHPGVHLTNPISNDMSVMRTTLWPSLVQTTLYNQARQQERVRIFESGLRFIEEKGTLKQELVLAGMITGSLNPEQWGEARRNVDFFDLKADVEEVLQLCGHADEIDFIAAESPSLHPGQSAKIELDGTPIGWIGMLHPGLESQVGLAHSSYVFELLVEPLSAGRLPYFEPLSKYPSIRRDIAIVVDESITFTQVKECVRKKASKILKDICLFDVYTGGNIDPGRKSLALGLILQENSRTLTDEDVEQVIHAVMQGLSDDLGAQMRE
ncbi:MAG TPA: phenylalanine--tRNA ligase subunit beta, partial [Chromatiales bacterium]|nr:phenylalanine--tRNA ligase subunit beta [Chromatiales bacterium]